MLKSMMRSTRPDAGTVTMFGLDMAADEMKIKQKVSFTLGAFDYYPHERLRNITAVYKRFYEEWNEAAYKDYSAKFGLDENKRVCELSAGMKVKYALTLALSHNAELFIFDEPTSGLDPIARDELLDIFQQIVEDGQKSILFSTHITSDLDKCADYILFIQNGHMVSFSTKDELIDAHTLISGTNEQLTAELKGRMISYKQNTYGFTGLLRSQAVRPTDGTEQRRPNLEVIMVYYDRQEAQP